MAIKIMDLMRIIDIIAFNFKCIPPAHSSVIWLQILGLTAGMHSFTSEAKYCDIQVVDAPPILPVHAGNRR